MTKKKILFITPNQFGYNTDHYYWCKYLQQKFQITYLCFKNHDVEFFMDGIEIKYIKFHSNRIVRVFDYYIKAIAELTNNNSDYTFIVQYKLDFILRFIFPFKKLFYDIRTGGVFDSKMARIIHDAQLTVSSKLFNRTTILSEGLRKKLYISNKKSTIVPLGAEIISATNKNFKTLHLLYIGVFSGRKIETTIEGFHEFHKEFPESTYSIIGFGYSNEESLIKEKITEYNLENNVFLLGRKNHKDAKQYFDQCNVGISFVPITPFYDHQPPTKNYEYLLSGMVCLATATSSNKKIVNENNGILINDNPYDFYIGLKQIYEKKVNYNSEIIRKSVEKNLWENIVKTKLYPILK